MSAGLHCRQHGLVGMLGRCLALRQRTHQQQIAIVRRRLHRDADGLARPPRAGLRSAKSPRPRATKAAEVEAQAPAAALQACRREWCSPWPRGRRCRPSAGWVPEGSTSAPSVPAAEWRAGCSQLARDPRPRERAPRREDRCRRPPRIPRRGGSSGRPRGHHPVPTCCWLLPAPTPRLPCRWARVWGTGARRSCLPRFRFTEHSAPPTRKAPNHSFTTSKVELTSAVVALSRSGSTVPAFRASWIRSMSSSAMTMLS